MYRTRIAPSPTGMMHFGTARTAYFCWLVAKSTGGQFILRMDDTDMDRNNTEADKAIFEGMDWLGLKPDEFYRQSERSDMYQAVAEMLLKDGSAFVAENGAIILRYHDWMPRSWHDEIAGDIAITDTNIEQIDGRTVLMRGGDKIGQYTYQFCSVVDDYLTKVNYVIRGTDHITNTAKQICIWSAIQRAHKNFEQTDDPDHQPVSFPKFAHVGLIFKDKKKMSKRDGAASLLWYRDEGYDPDALLNFMLRLGWGPTVDNKENSILPRDRAKELFLLGGRMRNTQAGFDQAKLDWFDKQYKRMKTSAAA